jgi:hypothetical protein
MLGGRASLSLREMMGADMANLNNLFDRRRRFKIARQVFLFAGGGHF